MPAVRATPPRLTPTTPTTTTITNKPPHPSYTKLHMYEDHQPLLAPRLSGKGKPSLHLKARRKRPRPVASKEPRQRCLRGSASLRFPLAGPKALHGPYGRRVASYNGAARQGASCQMVGEQHVHLCLVCCTFFVPQSLFVGVFS